MVQEQWTLFQSPLFEQVASVDAVSNGLAIDRAQCFLDPRGSGVNGRRHPGAGAAQRATGVAKGHSGPLTPETDPMLQRGFNQGVARRLIPLPCGEHGAWGRAPTSSAQTRPY